jgi:hypothetical protein
MASGSNAMLRDAIKALVVAAPACKNNLRLIGFRLIGSPSGKHLHKQVYGSG